MNLNTPQNSQPWIDPDDAPEITAADLRRGVWSVNGSVVSEAEGRAAFALGLKANAEAEKGSSPNNHGKKSVSRP